MTSGSLSFPAIQLSQFLEVSLAGETQEVMTRAHLKRVSPARSLPSFSCPSSSLSAAIEKEKESGSVLPRDEGKAKRRKEGLVPIL